MINPQNQTELLTDFRSSWLESPDPDHFGEYEESEKTVDSLIQAIIKDWSGTDPIFLLEPILRILLKNQPQFDNQNLEDIKNRVIEFLKNDDDFKEKVRSHFKSLNTSSQSLYQKHPILLHFPNKTTPPNEIDRNPLSNPILTRIVGSLSLVVLLSISVVIWVANRKFFPMPDSLKVVPGTKIKIAGSIAMLPLNQSFKEGFESKFPFTTIDLTAYKDQNNRASGNGIKLLCQGKIDIAAISRSLHKDEDCPDGKKLFATSVGTDSLSVIVHRDNPVNNLSKSQLQKIFRCQIYQWTEIDPTWTSKNLEIKVLNRPVLSGGFEYFQELFLDNDDFCPRGSPNYSNFKQLDNDEITLTNRNFTINQISYAAYGLTNYSGIKRLSIDNVKPEDEKYPYRRPLFYVYKADSAKNPSLPVKQFLGFVLNFDQSTK